MNRTARFLTLGFVTLVAAVVVASLPRIPQNPAYHQFADRREFFGVPNTFDVLSNVLFVPIGLVGVWYLLRRQNAIAFSDERERWPFVVFFAGVTLVGFGSGWYHLAPDNDRLVWDRLPMTIGFMGLVAALVAERISVRAGLWFLLPLLALGFASVSYWNFTEHKGAGDLRPYAFAQFFPLLLLPLLLWLFPARYTRSADYLGVFGFYVAAKILEALDRPIFELGHVVSGHTLKHLSAAAGVGWLLGMLIKRQPIPASPAAQ